MTDIYLQEIHKAEGALLLRRALNRWGFKVVTERTAGTALIIADRPSPALVPPNVLEILWWVGDATPEEVSDVLARRPGWVVRQSSPLEAVRVALEHIQQRDLGSEGWLRQMLHLATLDELLRFVLVRAEEQSKAKQGAIWVRQEEAFFQRCGEGFPEAPLCHAEAADLVRKGEAWLLCPGSQIGIIRLKEAQGEAEQFLGWIKEVEDLLVNAWNLEQSLALACKDDLTVARNRRALEAELPQLVRDAAARGESVSLLFLDVDNLKALNSHYGHPTGSKVLTHVALEAKRIIRAQDRLYRYGGDEFCIVIPATSTTGAVRMGERLLQTLSESPVRVGETDVPISISSGIATYPQHADGAEHLLEKADRALFRAKSAGKGRVMVAEP